VTRILLAGLAALAVSAVASAQRMQIQFAEPVDIPDRAGDVEFDAYGRRFSLELESNDRLTRSLSAVRKAELSDSRPQRGRLAGVPRSWVRLTRVGGAFEGAIWDGADLYVVTSAGRVAPHLTTPLAVPGDTTVVYRLSDTLNALPEGFCGLDRHLPLASPVNGTTALKQYQATVATLQAISFDDQLEISLIADTQFQNMFSGYAAATMVARLNVVDGIFAEQVGVLIVPSELRLLPVSNPLSSSDPETLLEQLSDFRQSTPAVRAPGLAHLLTGKPLTGGTLGIAFLDSLCDPDRGVSLTMAEPEGMQTALVMAHEIAHNFGAVHDGVAGRACASTSTNYLMAPFHNGSWTLSQCSLDSMAPAIVRARNACLGAPNYADLEVSAQASTTSDIDADFRVPVTIRNVGNRPATNSLLVLEVPFYVTAGTSSVNATCTTPSSGAVRCELGTIAAGETRVVEVSMRGARTAPFANAIARVSADNDYLVDDNDAPFNLVFRSNIDLAVASSASPATIYEGDPFEVHVDVNSLRSGTARGATLEVNINSFLRPTSIVAGAHTCTDNPTTRYANCQLAEIAPGASTRITFVFAAGSDHAFGLTPRVLATLDDNITNNAISSFVTIRPDRAALITTDVEQIGAVIGQVYESNFTLTAAGRLDSDAARMQVHAPYLGLGVIESLTPSAGTCGAPTTTVTICQFGAMAAGESRSVLVRWRMTQEGRSNVGASGFLTRNGDVVFATTTTWIDAGIAINAVASGSTPFQITEGGSGDAAVVLQSEGVNLAQNIEAILEVAAPVQLSNLNLAGAHALTCELVNAQRARCTGSLTTTGNVILQYRYASTIAGNFPLSFTVTAPGDGNTTNDRVELQVRVLPYLDAGVTTTTARADLMVGETTTVPYTVTTGANPVPGVSARVSAQSSNIEIVSMNAGGSVCQLVSTEWQCALGDLPAGSGVPVTVTYRALRADQSGSVSVYVRTARDSNSSNDYAFIPYQTSAMTAVALDIAATSASAQAGERFLFPAITASSATAFARDVVVEISLPTFVTIDSLSTSANCSGTTTLRCDFGVIAGGQSRGIDVWLTSAAGASGTFTSNVTLRAANDSTANDNARTVAMTVTAPSSGGGSSSSSSSSGGGKGGGGSFDWLALLLLALPAGVVLTRRSNFRRALHDSITRRESGVMSRADR
jgi:hypothetical protein